MKGNCSEMEICGVGPGEDFKVYIDGIGMKVRKCIK